MQLSETELFDLLQTSTSFRRSCAHTLAVLLADTDSVYDAMQRACAPADDSAVEARRAALVDNWE